MGAVRALILVTFGTAAASLTHAQVTEIYNCVDKEGKRLYTSDKRETNTPGLKCKLVSREVNVVPAPANKPPPAASPSTFPRETPTAKQSAKDRQREILEKELASEQRLLDDARKQLAEQESMRMGDEKNYARVLDRLQPYKDNVDLHQKNIEALKRELSNIR
jgi:septal ring factor EnvC (AmiA/AmiB activator)